MTQHWVALASTVVAVLVLALLWTLLRRRPPSPEDYDISRDRFQLAMPITDEQVALLHYLQQVFPEGAVLFRPSLVRFLTVRASQSRQAAQQRLARLRVDFLICSDEGVPLFAFDVDLFRDRDDTQAQRRIELKNRVLKGAGIRLIRLKGTRANWPEPDALRGHLLAALRPQVPRSEMRPSGYEASAFGQSAFGPSGFAPSAFPPSRSAESGVMGLTGLMGLQPQGGNAWEDVRKR